jgi:carbamoyltransferase
MRNNYVLGLNFLHSDTSACIFKDGVLLAATEEERFSRIKHVSLFPSKSIEFCLAEADIDLSEVNVISINSNPFSSITRKVIYTLKNFKRMNLAFSSLKNIKEKYSLRDYISRIDSNKKFNGKIEYIDHHESHIASSLYFSNFKKSVNLSIDGFGDFASSAWGIYLDKKNQIHGRIFFPHSMGIFYQAITQFLGFKNYGDEYKVMGLSSYGYPRFEKELSKIIYNTKKGFELNLDFFIHHNKKIISLNVNGQIQYKNLYSKKLLELLGPERNTNQEISQHHKDIASSAQKVYENTLFNLLNNLYSKYKIENLTLSGGCAMNSVANGKILKNTPFKNIYISPNPGDAGGSIGSAATFLINSDLNISPVSQYAYLGMNYSNKEIENTIHKNDIYKKFKVKKLSSDEIIEITTSLLIDSKIVGWFQGRSEWGPRALGNRSILADARNPNIKKIINSKIKRRESFRPFAPSILFEHTKEWFDIEKEVPYMSEVYSILKDKRELLPGITHIDGTGRLQTVSIHQNKKYFLLIKRFFERTGIPIILNTSFNENEPIVNSPIEAINCFERTSMDALVLENWIILR